MSGGEQGYAYSKLLRSNSAFAVTAGQSSFSLTNWIADLGTTCQKINRVSVISCTFNNNGYNINGGTSTDPNNVGSFARIDSGINPNAFTIPEGFYNTSDLITAVLAGVAPFMTSGQTFTLTQNALNNKVSLTWTAGTTSYTQLQIIANYGSDINAGSVWEALGFTIGQTALPGVPLVATNLPKLTGLRQVYLTSSAMAPANQIDEKGNYQNVLINIPVTAAFGAVNVWECKVDSLCQITYKQPRNLQRVDFQLRDEDGSIVDLHGSSVKVELKVWFNKET